MIETLYHIIITDVFSKQLLNIKLSCRIQITSLVYLYLHQSLILERNQTEKYISPYTFVFRISVKSSQGEVGQKFVTTFGT